MAGGRELPRSLFRACFHPSALHPSGVAPNSEIRTPNEFRAPHSAFRIREWPAMSTKLQPALLAGLVLGVLSSLPIVSAGNCCCGLWFVTAGVLAAWLMQQNQPFPIALGDGALVGLLDGRRRHGGLGDPVRADSGGHWRVAAAVRRTRPRLRGRPAAELPRDAREQPGTRPAGLRSGARVPLHAGRRRGVHDARRALGALLVQEGRAAAGRAAAGRRRSCHRRRSCRPRRRQPSEPGRRPRQSGAMSTAAAATACGSC